LLFLAPILGGQESKFKFVHIFEIKAVKNAQIGIVKKTNIAWNASKSSLKDAMYFFFNCNRKKII